MWSKDRALEAPSLEGCRELVLTDPAWKWIIGEIYGRRLGVFQIPTEDPDEIPSFAIAIPPSVMSRPK